MDWIPTGDVLRLVQSGLWAGLIPAVIAAPLVFKALVAIKSTQIISRYVPEHQSKQGTPTMGGLIVVGALLAACAWGLSSGALTTGSNSLQELPGGREATDARGFVFLVLGFALIGFLDDYVMPKLARGKRGLGWTQKLLLQFMVAVPASWLFVPAYSVVYVVFAFVTVAFSNAFNLSDGMDGLAGGLAVILAITFLAIGFFCGAPVAQMWLCLALVGALLPFLLLNAPPAKLFMGDVGSLPIGAALGWLMLHSMHGEYPNVYNSSWLIAVSLAVFVMLAELIPVPIQILSVKLLKKRLPIRTPIHHTFESAGWPETRIVALFHLCQAVLSFAAIAVAAHFVVIQTYQ